VIKQQLWRGWEPLCGAVVWVWCCNQS